MAKKHNETITDDFKLDDFDDFDFDFPDPTIKDDRDPVTKIKTGVIKGAKERVQSVGFIKEAVKHTFPRSLGQAIDLGDQVTETARNLYDDSVKEIKPTLMMAKRTIGKLVPADAKVLPKSVQETLKRWKDLPESEDSPQISKEVARDAILGQTLRDIFTTQEQLQQQRMADQTGRDNLVLGIEQVRYKNTLDAMNRSAMSLKRLDAYNTSIGLNYQRKSLELQYRLLFSSQDALQFSKEKAARGEQFLAAIAKNTALPDYVKFNNKELRSDTRRRKTFDLWHEALFGNTDRLLFGMIERTRNQLMDKVKGFSQDVRSGLQEASSMGDMAQMGHEMGADITSAAAEGVGGAGAQSAGNWLGKKIWSTVQGSKLDKRFGLTDKAHKVEARMENLPREANEFKNDTSDYYDTSILGSLKNLIREYMPQTGPDKSLAQTTSKNLFEATHFNNATQRSITEVIPGYLARIFRELQVQRTGDSSISLTDFSHDRGSFTDRGELQKEVISKTVPERNKRYVNRDLNDMVTDIGKDQQLSPQESAAIKKRLLTNSAKNNLASEKNLAEAKNYKGEDASVAASAAAAMKKYMAGLTPEQRTAFARRHNQLSEGMADPRQQMQDLLETGNIDHLRDLGLIEEKGEGPIKDVKVNIDEIVRRYLDDPDAAGAGGGSGPFVGPLPPSALGQLTRAVKKSQGAQKLGGLYAAGAQKTAGLKSKLLSSYSGIKTNLPGYQQKALGLKNQLAGHYGNLKMQLPGYQQKAAGYLQQAQQAYSGFQMPQFAMPAITPEHRQAFDRAVDTAQQQTQKFSSQAADLVSPEQLKKAAEYATQQKSNLTQTVSPTLKKISEAAEQLKTKGAPLVQKGREVAKDKLASGKILAQELGESGKQSFTKLLAGLSKGVNALSAAVSTGVAKGKQALVDSADQRQLAKTTALSGLDKVAQTGRAAGTTIIAQAAAAGAGIGKGVDKAREQLSQARTGHDSENVYDLYVGTENTPRLTAVKMAQGLYRQRANGKVVTDVNDVKSTIVDETGSVVVTGAELSKLVYFDPLRGTWRYLYSQGKLGVTDVVKDLSASFSKGALSLVSSLKNMAVDAFKKDTPSDVYVQGENAPRLLAVNMAKGEYTDAQSGEVIKSPKDIKGPVKDKEGQTVITTEDLSKLSSFDWQLRKWSPLWIGKKLIQAAWAFETGFAWKWTKFNFRMLGKAAKFLMGPVARTVGRALGLKIPDPPKDVYVAGEEQPRLTSTGFKKGYYRDKETGMVLRDQTQISGQVVDQNDNTILDTEDLKNLMVYDTKLSRFSPLRLFKVLAWLAKLPFKLAAWALKKTVGAGLKVTKAYGKKVLPKVLGGLGAVAKGIGSAGAGLLGIQRGRQALAVTPSPEQQAQAETQANANKYKLVDRFKNTAATAVGKFKGLFGLKVKDSELAGLPVGEAAAVKSSGTLEKIFGLVKVFTQPKKSPLDFSKDDKRGKDAEEKESQLRGTLAERLGVKSKKGEGKEGEKGGLLGAFESLKGVLGAIGPVLASLGSTLAPVAAVAAAGMAGYFGAKALGAGKLGSWLGNKAADLFGTDPMKQMEENEKKAKGEKSAQSSIISQAAAGTLPDSIRNAKTFVSDAAKNAPGSAATVAAQQGGVTTGEGLNKRPVGTQAGALQTTGPSYLPRGDRAETPSATLRGATAGANSTQAVNGLSDGPANPNVKVPEPTGRGAKGMTPTIEGAAKLVGVDSNSVMQVVAMESAFNPDARAGTSSAAGLGQFTSGTWNTMMRKYASKYGIDPSTPPTEPKAAAIMTAQFLKDNIKTLATKTRHPIGATEAYLAHFLGVGGASAFLQILDKNPDAPLAPAMPAAAAANRPIFFNGTQVRSAQQVYALLDNRLKQRARSLGLSIPDAGDIATKSGTDESGSAGTDVASAAPTAPQAATGATPGPSYRPAVSGPPRASNMTTMPAPAMPQAAPVAVASAPQSAVSQPNMVGGMSSEVFAKAEDILAKQLSVQEQMRDYLKTLVEAFPNLHEGITQAVAANKGSGDSGNGQNNADSSDKSNSRPPSSSYDIPRGAISMKRAIA